jgi:hypothetical protein
MHYENTNIFSTFYALCRFYRGREISLKPSDVTAAERHSTWRPTEHKLCGVSMHIHADGYSNWSTLSTINDTEIFSSLHGMEFPTIDIPCKRQLLIHSSVPRRGSKGGSFEPDH